jgi:hypothetical protein
MKVYVLTTIWSNEDHCRDWDVEVFSTYEDAYAQYQQYIQDTKNAEYFNDSYQITEYNCAPYWSEVKNLWTAEQNNVSYIEYFIAEREVK